VSGRTPSRRAIFWFDAHGDLNTPDTTTSGFLDGTGFATALGLCWRGLASGIPGFEPVDSTAAFLLGARDLDPPEAALIGRGPITAVSSTRLAAELPEVLSRAPLEDALGHVHLDLDALDPARVGRANSLPVPDGLSVEQLTGAIATIRARVTLGAATLASYAPEFDTGGAVCRAALAAIDSLLSESP
jgi:arginase